MQLNNFTVQHTNTYMHTDTTCIQHVNMGLAQARPSYTLTSCLYRIEVGQLYAKIALQYSLLLTSHAMIFITVFSQCHFV